MQKLKAIFSACGEGYAWLKRFLADSGLEILLFVIACGSADTIHFYMTQTGSPDTWQLRGAVYALEILIVWASLWGSVGMFVSFSLFCVSLISIQHVFGDNWLGHSSFSIAVFLGSLGNYVRRGHWRELYWIMQIVFDIRNAKTILTNAMHNFVDLTGMTVADIKMRYNLTLEQANKAKQLWANGTKLTVDMMKEL